MTNIGYMQFMETKMVREEYHQESRHHIVHSTCNCAMQRFNIQDCYLLMSTQEMYSVCTYLVGVFPQQGHFLGISDLIRLIILKYTLPVSTCTTSPDDVASVLEGFHATALAGSSVPRPVYTGFRTSGVSHNLRDAV